MSRRLLALIAAFAISLFVFAPMGASAQTDVPQVPDDVVAGIDAMKATSTYIVVMDDEPLVVTEGRDNLDSGKANKQERKLRGKQDKALRSVGASTDAKVYDYTVAVSGFAAELTQAQAAALAAQPGVMAVYPDETRQLTTDNTPDFLELTAPAGPYAKGLDGEGVVVGVIDQGVWPEHLSFADDGSYSAPPASFSGTGCEFGSAVPGAQAFNPADADFICNNKLLAAKAYGLGFHGGVGAGLDPGSFISARDEDGHGSHTASTAAGNASVPVTLLGVPRGTVSGIAPRAHLSIYKACWSTSPTAGGCNVSDLMAAIDDAVEDGVDVINYSIGSSSVSIGADDIAFLFAADAGVFVATSAGNNGPGASTVGSPATVPWVTAVGASTQSREFIGSVNLGDGSSYSGITVTGGVGPAPIVDAANHGNALCDPNVAFVPPVTGNIVLCLRGVFARVAKSQAVFNDGGVGMVLYNVADTQTQNTDNHYVPSVHINNTDGVAVATYIATALTPTATINGGVATPTPGNVMASFSSRGSNLLSEDIIKPDVTGPGVNVLAANTPAALLGSPGELFQSISGTSMSSPHAAGAYALLKQARPDWSAAIAKSALMTTARQDVVKEDGATPADPFDFGAGHIRPGGKAIKGSLYEPGLAYDAGFLEYLGFLCDASPGTLADPTGTCNFLDSIGVPTDASDLNLASIGIGELVGSQTVTRTVTSVAKENGWRTYNVSVDAPAGFDVTVSPSSFKIKKGQTVSYEVTIANDGSATLGAWSFGSLTWNDTTGHYDVRSPIAVRAFEFAGPSEISGTGTSGNASFDVQFGYDGPYTAAPHGLVAAGLTAGNVVDDPANNINVALGSGVGVTFHFVPVPAGTAHARFSLFDAFTDGNDDLDLYVFDPGGSFVGGSGSPTSAEQVDVPFPVGGSYIVVVHGWQTDGPDANYTLFDWSVPLASGGSLSVDSAPTAATVGGSGTVDVSWSGLAAATKYLGAVSHTGPSGLLGLTLVNVEAP